jgi:hypothetical protein
MSLNHLPLPLELLELILGNIFLDEWNRYAVLDLRTVCRKYFKARLLKASAEQQGFR